jgi:hypothetical protein
LVDTIWCTSALYKRWHADNCEFLIKFVAFEGKYRKCQKKMMLYLINPIPRNPGPISRESRNKKIVGIPGIREREIPGMGVHIEQVGAPTVPSAIILLSNELEVIWCHKGVTVFHSITSI